MALLLGTVTSFAGKSRDERKAILKNDDEKMIDKVVVIGSGNPSVAMIGTLIGIDLQDGDNGVYYVQRMHLLQLMQTEKGASFNMTPYCVIGRPEDRPQVFRVRREVASYIMPAPKEAASSFLQATTSIMTAG